MANNSSSCCELGGNGKRQCVEEDTTATDTDRLSHLPESIIHHMLSFLDTKSAVQTSVLSRVWRCAWRHVHVLDFRRGSFRRYSSFQRYVENVLSLRCPFSVSKVTLTSSDDDEEDDDGEKREFGLLVRVIKYALSHDARHLVINRPDTLKLEERYRFSDLFGTTLDCKLEALELGGFYIDSGFGSAGFSMLTTLCLKNCELVSDEDVDLFGGFPRLKNLLLNCCIRLYLDRRLKISGTKLISLKLLCLSALEVKIFAPKLKFLSLHYYGPSLKFSEWSLPSLYHADIWVDLYPGFIKNNAVGLATTLDFFCSKLCTMQHL